jgi:uncharacterized protein (TIGR04255 family)
MDAPAEGLAASAHSDTNAILERTVAERQSLPAQENRRSEPSPSDVQVAFSQPDVTELRRRENRSARFLRQGVDAESRSRAFGWYKTVVPWRFPKTSRRVFARNPLEVVIFQLRFSPILKLVEHPGPFQERVRERFPDFVEVEVSNVEVRPFENLRLRKEKEYRFIAAERGTTLFLGSSSLGLDCQTHFEREQLLGDVNIGVQALLRTANRISPVRVGLRYVNIIRPSRIAQDLGRSVALETLVSKDLLHAASVLADSEGATHNGQITAPIDDGGMTLHYGTISVPDEPAPAFRVDIDRFQETAIDPTTIESKLLSFTEDIFSLFSNLAGTDLIEWMNVEKKEA